MPEPTWRDKHGDVWKYNPEDGLMHSFETRPFTREMVERKWGPLVPLPAVSAAPERPEAALPMTRSALYEVIREAMETAWDECRAATLEDVDGAHGYAERENPYKKKD